MWSIRRKITKNLNLNFQIVSVESDAEQKIKSLEEENQSLKEQNEQAKAKNEVFAFHLPFSGFSQFLTNQIDCHN